MTLSLSSMNESLMMNLIQNYESYLTESIKKKLINQNVTNLHVNITSKLIKLTFSLIHPFQ
jgi:hypothetical protein